ncbi:glycerol kinase GlpK [Leptolyngbya sp. AN03gr2]|uniref:glycerol kinase GlpK n=1 Tax=unclassified Leptolyngbya TaxID=2650499 RepID=UPI003D3244E2
MAKYILALDLGTTGNRAFLFDHSGNIAGQTYLQLQQYYPQPGWLEHDAEEIWNATQSVIRSTIQNIDPADIAAIGLTVQRETCLLWDKTTGKPLHRAIVWQDRRTADFCNELRDQGFAEEIYDRTGLVIDAYFSATKLRWLLDRVEGVDLNNVLAGTIDTWILWKLTNGKVHATDHSNASRTLLMNLKTLEWDERLLEIFGIPRQILPSIQPSLGTFGIADLFKVPITAILGDQQAALFGQGCDRPGLMKCTYGTGSFLVAHTGSEIVRSNQQLISTIAWTDSTQIGYALEGSMFTSGACVQWLRDGLGLIKTAQETEAIAQQVSDNGGVYFVPALSGLGTPHWDMSARGAFLGITGGVKREHMVRAVLEAIAFQVKEVVDEIETYSPIPLQKLSVDGGACENNFLMQLQADVLGIPIERPAIRDTTVLGVAFAAGLACGFWQRYDQLVEHRVIDRIFEPRSSSVQADFKQWQKAVDRAKCWQ